MIRTAHHLIDLSQLKDSSVAGSKAFNLGRVAELGLATPGGAAVPDSVFQEHLQAAGLLPEVVALHSTLQVLPQAEIETSAAAIRKKLSAAPLATGLLAALQQDFGSQLASGGRLAVRSSALGEDSATASFAGQLDSILNVDSMAALESALKASWCSLFSNRVLLYSRSHRLACGHMGVIVQPQVAARMSGVLFTVDPTGRHAGSMVLEYGSGLGDRLVGGEITPSRIRIRRDDLGITEEYRAPESEPPGPSAVFNFTELSKIGLRLESVFGAAQDIEWCTDNAERLVILQSRPATHCIGPNPARRQHWSNANIAENFPEPVSPFLFSVVRAGYSAYFRNLGLGFGLSRRRIDAMSGAFDGIVGLQGGRLYYNLSNIHSLLLIMPAGERLVEFFTLFVGADRISAPSALRLNRWARAFESVRIAASVLWQYVFIHRRMRRFERRVDDFADRTHPSKLPDKTAEELAGDVSGFLRIRLQQWNDAALADTAAMVCYGVLKARLARWLNIADHSALHNDLLKGLPGLASSRPVTELWKLSRQIGNDDTLKSLFLEQPAEQILERIGDPEFAAFKKSFEQYLDQWGFRSSAELMLTMPTPVEDPRPLLDLLAAYLRSDHASPGARTAEQTRARLATTSEIAALISPVRWWRAVPIASAASRFRTLLAATQGAIRLRERARMKQALLYTRLRHIALQLGTRLVERGVLAQRDDIFMLPVHELLDIVAHGTTDAEGLSARVATQRQAMREFASMQPPDHIVLDEGVSWRPVPAVRAGERLHQDQLRGTGACGGIANGAAAVVLDVANAGRVKAGQILVTRQTDPGWAAVFFLVHGLVIERGGMLSHGAIIAREYGIPAVVGVANATRVIRDGDRLSVDGDQGLVEFDHC